MTNYEKPQGYPVPSKNSPNAQGKPSRPQEIPILEAMFKPLARALDASTRLDERIAGRIPSTKDIIED
jgi:hypothetical protein